MTSFRTRALRLLDQLYEFGAGAPSAPTDADVTAPLQFIHDVSRTAELGKSVVDPRTLGYFQIGQDNVHAGAGALAADVPVYPTLDALFGPDAAQRLWAWLIFAGLQVEGTATLVTSSLALKVQPIGNALALRDFLIARWNVVQAMDVGGAWGFGAYHGAAATPGPIMQLPLPLWVPAGASFGFYSDASMAGTIRFSSICWAGPIGVFPPGMR